MQYFFLPGFPWTKLCLCGYNLPKTSSHRKDGEFSYPTVFSGSYVITANVIVTLMLTCGEGRRGENFFKWVIPITLKHITCVICIQTGMAPPVRLMCTRFLWASSVQRMEPVKNVMSPNILQCA